MGNSVKGLTKVQVDEVHSLTFFQYAGHLIIKGDLFGEAGFHTVLRCGGRTQAKTKADSLKNNIYNFILDLT